MQEKILSNVISIGYGRNLFDEDSPERKRMEVCAQASGSLHMIIFTNKSDQLLKVETDTGLVLHPTNSSSKIGMVLDAFKIAGSIIKSSESLPIVTTQDPFEAGIIGLFLKTKFKIHLTVQEHGDVFSTPHWRNESMMNRIRYIIGKFILRRADTVRVVSDRIAKTIISLGVDAKKITKLPVATDVSPFKSIQKNPQVRQIFPEPVFVFLTVGRFVEQKNPTLMIDAFSEVYKVNQNVRLLIVGSGKKENEIRGFIKKKFGDSKGDTCPVQILSWSNDVVGLMAASDAYVLSSNYEGWGRVLIEAMCSGLPAVSTDVGCANEVFKNNIHGYVVPVNDRSKLISAMLEMVSNKDKYSEFKKNLESLDHRSIPGTDIPGYGQAWVSALKS